MYAQLLLQRISTIWASAQRLVYEIKLARRRYPMVISLIKKKSSPAPFLRIATRIHCHRARACLNVHFELTGEEITAVDESQIVAELGCSVESVFGQIESVLSSIRTNSTEEDCSAVELSYIVRDFVSNGGRGALLQACEAAEAKVE